MKLNTLSVQQHMIFNKPMQEVKARKPQWNYNAYTPGALLGKYTAEHGATAVYHAEKFRTAILTQINPLGACFTKRLFTNFIIY